MEARAFGLSKIQQEKDLIQAFDFLTAEKLRHLTLGGGSNVLFVDDFKGWVLKNEILGKELLSEQDDFVELLVGSGENWHEFVIWSLDQGYCGLENLSLIPGSVGAAPIQNIGAYGVEVKDVITKVEGYDLDGQFRVFENSACEFGYRESIFKLKLLDRFFITRVGFRLSKTAELNLDYGPIQQELKKREIHNPTSKDVSNVVIDIRRSKLPDPKDLGNAGSFFKNPVVAKALFRELLSQYPDIPHYATEDDEEIKIPAGWLIEKAGWKGVQDGQAGVHKNQALVLVNLGQAKGIQICELSKKIQEDVFEKFGVSLVPEVRMVT